MQGQIRLTEQGEVITAKYGNPEVGRRNLEVLAAATVEASLLAHQEPAPEAAYLAAMEELSADAFRAYRDLVYETDGFEQYFWESTVISEIAGLNIGSRPASRKKTTAIEDLRAIPWVFSWSQCRLMLPGWLALVLRYSVIWQNIRTPASQPCKPCSKTGLSSRRYCRIWKWCWQKAISVSPAVMRNWFAIRHCVTAFSRVCRMSTA
jgi:hypothetical protein